MIATVLDYVSGNVNIVEVPEELKELSGDEIMDKMGYDCDAISYMISETPFKISVLTSGMQSDITFK